LRVCITDVVNCVAYYIVGSIVRNTLAVIIVMKYALNIVELAVFDENPGEFAEQLFDGFNHGSGAFVFWGYQLLLVVMLPSLYPELP
jgi:hypothetical protein